MKELPIDFVGEHSKDPKKMAFRSLLISAIFSALSYCSVSNDWSYQFTVVMLMISFSTLLVSIAQRLKKEVECD